MVKNQDKSRRQALKLQMFPTKSCFFFFHFRNNHKGFKRAKYTLAHLCPIPMSISTPGEHTNWFVAYSLAADCRSSDKTQHISTPKILVKITFFSLWQVRSNRTMSTDDFGSDRIVRGLRNLAREVPSLQGRANLSPLEIMDEIEKYVQELAEQIERIGEKKRKARGGTDKFNEKLRELKELAHHTQQQIRRLKNSTNSAVSSCENSKSRQISTNSTQRKNSKT